MEPYFEFGSPSLLNRLLHPALVALMSFWIAALLWGLNRAERLARTDELTGLPNRRALIEKLAATLRSPFPIPGSFSLVMLDCDGFKRVNDQSGHQKGDEILRRIAVTLRENIGPDAFVARLGGDEFCLILFHANLEQSRTRIDRLRSGLRIRSIDEFPDLTFSIGVMEVCAVDGSIPVELNPIDCLNYVDQVMYAAKREGPDTTRLKTLGDE